MKYETKVNIVGTNAQIKTVAIITILIIQLLLPFANVKAVNNIEEQSNIYYNQDEDEINLVSGNIVKNYLFHVLKYISNMEEQEIENTVLEKISLYENGEGLENIIKDLVNSQKEYLNTLNDEDFIKAIYNGVLLWEPCTELSQFEGRYYENILYEDAINTLKSTDESNENEIANKDEVEDETNQSTNINEENELSDGDEASESLVENDEQDNSNQLTDDNKEDIRYNWVINDVLEYDKFTLIKEQISKNDDFNFEIIQQGKINLSSRNKGDINDIQPGINSGDVLTLQKVIYERTELGGNRYEDYVDALDVDNSGIVDTDDVKCLAEFVGKGTLQTEDLNNDGIVDFEDFVISYNKKQQEEKNSLLTRFILNMDRQ